MAYVQVPRATSALRATMASMAMVCLSQATCGDPVQGRAEGPVRGGRRRARAGSDAPAKQSGQRTEPTRGATTVGTVELADTSAAPRARPGSGTSTKSAKDEKKSFGREPTEAAPAEPAEENPAEREQAWTSRRDIEPSDGHDEPRRESTPKRLREERRRSRQREGHRHSGVPAGADSDKRRRRRRQAGERRRAAGTPVSEEPIAQQRGRQETQARQPAVERRRPPISAARERRRTGRGETSHQAQLDDGHDDDTAGRDQRSGHASGQGTATEVRERFAGRTDRLRHGAVPDPHELDEQRQPDARVRVR